MGLAFFLGNSLKKSLLWLRDKKRTPLLKREGFTSKEGGDILSHQMAVPSALSGLTTLFGMGRGEPRCYNHLKFLSHRVIMWDLIF
jgi:hypothetical protein